MELHRPNMQIKGVVKLGPAMRQVQRWSVLLLALGPLAGVVVAIVELWGHGVDLLDVILATVMYCVSILGVTVGYHRMLTHRSFDTPSWVRYAYAVAGSTAAEGDVLGWVADHRRHHAFSDQHGDPHSPHAHKGHEGVRATLGSLWHAHMGWLFEAERTSAKVWAPELYADRGLRVISHLFGPLVLVGIALPGAAALWITGSWHEAFLAVVWGGAVRMFVLHQVTFSINSICHVWGRQEYQTTDESRNVWPLALLSFGESWHNNHHAFPSSAKHGLKPWQIDISAATIRVMEWLRLARNVRRPSAATLARRALPPQHVPRNAE